MCENVVERGRPQMTIWRTRVAFWIPKATNAHSGCVILFTFPLQLWLHERVSMLGYTYIACLVRLIRHQTVFATNSNVIWTLKTYSLLQIYQNTRCHIPEHITVL